MEEAARPAVNAHLDQLKLTIRDAWRTLSMLPDPDARFRRMFGGSWSLPIVQDPNTAYGATPASWMGTPTAHEISTMESVFGWLAWLRRIDGEESIKRIAAWAMGRPIWKIAQRERCSAATIHNRINRSVAKILAQFLHERVEIAPIDEPEPRSERIRGFTPPHGVDQSGAVTEPGKVFIDGVGFMYRGEKYQSSYDGRDVSGRKKRR